MKVGFSKQTRAQDLQEMASHGVDLLVIGGGITGAGIAWDAAQRGLRVGVLEQRDWACGTSSRSTKLIHGGLRYLAQGEIALVREVGRERAILHRLAPHTVYPMKLLLPIYRGGEYSKIGASVGLWLYDRLAGVKRAERRRMLSKTRTRQLEPGLNEAGLRGGGLYVEYRTDDSRLTMEVLKTASQSGARLANYAKVTELRYDESGRVNGVHVQDLVGKRTLEISAKVVVNAAGPWVDEVRRFDGALTGKRLHLTKGVHLTVDQADLPLQHAVYTGTDDGRMIFLVPRGKRVYIGTTDTNYTGDIAKPICTREDAEYILRAVNQNFPHVNLRMEHVKSSWAGLRPLLHEDGKSPSELSRKEEIFKNESGLYSMAGGKLTGFRKMAEKIVDRVTQDLIQAEGRTFKSCSTDLTPLSGGSTGGQGFEPFYEAMQIIGQEEYCLQVDVIDALLLRYGSNIRTILRYIEEQGRMAERVGGRLPILRAEVRYSVEHEMTLSLVDFLVRRTGDLLFAAEEALEAAPALLDALVEFHGWDESERKRQWQAWEEAIEEARGFLHTEVRV
ncbi:glycerol-3-phosphate dehydrogenase/oxidase [Tumebacillus permanentifrigoris]|uniref:Glycerol-3-phosphate dehydrogenase n=1 Tax=Tumebacillus permanentifrigoris TaxID=378543 RepID=A0A316DD19_9BACL|nr:glycerol-3-phosphate dehydrogenase/oxidase [Tumebacillus permanentifrigoris]PWK14403.1 glycerol-3-phosphate dehydrogenase [Tumebacillus permanentifrigoris]